MMPTYLLSGRIGEHNVLFACLDEAHLPCDSIWTYGWIEGDVPSKRGADAFSCGVASNLK